MEARLNGFRAMLDVNEVDIEASDLIVGTTGHRSITKNVLDRVHGGTMVASASSRQLEIDIHHLQQFRSLPVHETVDSYQVENSLGTSPILLLNRGFPVNFIPSSGSVADEIVELILAEMIVLMRSLASDTDKEPGIHRISLDQERQCAQSWLKMRHRQNIGISRTLFPTQAKGFSTLSKSQGNPPAVAGAAHEIPSQGYR